ncbi:Profilin-2 [Porphyridium purpureum]|uniref:Profilin n=1 Tax=Porphyridium purpureum TaxID=35688 RepID=A0A5J4YQV6_PORPP|nr:Profilin-2 [Porphyridium purpureum]|eukprot:POR0516..scf236_6
MSWQQYVDSGMLAKGCMYAGIFGHNGSKWATSQGFQLGVSEATKLARILVGKEDGLQELARGFSICGQQYVALRAGVLDADGFPPFVLGQCVDKGKEQQRVIVICTLKALVVGVYHPKYSKNRNLRDVAKDMDQLTDYIIGVGY